MKSILWILAILTFFSSSTELNGQIIENYIHRKPFTFSSCVAYNQGYIFFNQAYSGYWEFRPYEQWLIKSNLNLEAIDSLSINALVSSAPGNVVQCNKILKWNDGVMVMASNWVRDTSNIYGSRQESHILILDTALNITNHIIINDSTFGIELFDMAAFGNSWYGCGLSSNDSNYIPCMVKIDPQTGQFYYNEYYQNNNSAFETFFTLGIANGKILVSIDGGIPPISDKLIGVVDTNLVLLSRNSTTDPTGEPVYMPNPGYFLIQSTGPPILLSSAHGEHDLSWNFPYMLMGAGQLDWNYSIADIDTFNFSGNNAQTPLGTINPKPISDAFDFSIADSALFVMAGQEMLYGFGYGDQFANDIYFYNYNGVLKNLNWTRIFNNGYSQSSISPVEVLPNNQYLVILNEYNWDKYSYPNLSIHLMILNANGDLISNPELPYQREVIRAFPNPCSDHVELSGLEQDQTGTYSYQLMDITGALIEEGAIQEDNQIFFKDDVTGTRVLQVLSEGKLVQSILLLGE